MIKLLIADGCSFTAGYYTDYLVNPELVGLENFHLMDNRNDNYRLPKLWPHMLGDKLGIETWNISYLGSSNHGIVRRSIEAIEKALETYHPSEILYICGWSSPLRKEYFVENKSYKIHPHWSTMLPGVLHDGKYETFFVNSCDDETFMKRKEEFVKFHVDFLWNKKGYETQFKINDITLRGLCAMKGIKGLFFHAFGDDYKNTSTNEEYLDVSFDQFLLNSKLDRKELYAEDNDHPGLLGHKIWADYLYKIVTNE